MSLYGRRDFEEDQRVIEETRHMAREQLLARQMDGFRFNRVMRQLDELEAKSKGKLAATRNILSQKGNGGFSAGKADGEYRAAQEARQEALRSAIQRQQEHNGQVKKESDRMGKKGL